MVLYILHIYQDDTGIDGTNRILSSSILWNNDHVIMCNEIGFIMILIGVQVDEYPILSYLPCRSPSEDEHDNINSFIHLAEHFLLMLTLLKTVWRVDLGLGLWGIVMMSISFAHQEVIFNRD